MIPTVYMGQGRFAVASPYHRARCDKLYGEGQEVIVEDVGDGERDMNKHRAYFARLKELWHALPEWIADDFESPEHLRKWSLCRTGYCSKRQLVLPSNSKAIEAAAFINQLDKYVICEVNGRVLTVWQAYSQAVKAMGGKAFQKSMADVLHCAEKLVATPRPKDNVVGFGQRKET